MATFVMMDNGIEETGRNFPKYKLNVIFCRISNKDSYSLDSGLTITSCVPIKCMVEMLICLLSISF